MDAMTLKYIYTLLAVGIVGTLLYAALKEIFRNDDDHYNFN